MSVEEFGEVVSAFGPIIILLGNLALAFFVTYRMANKNLVRDHKKRFYKLKSDASLHMEKINEYHYRAKSHIKHLKGLRNKIESSMESESHEQEHVIGLHYDFKRVFFKFLDLRDEYFNDRVKLKDNYNDLVALMKEMRDDKIFISKLRGKGHKEVFFNQVCHKAYFSIFHFLTALGYENFDARIEGVVNKNQNPAEDLPSPIITGMNRKAYYGIWLKKDLYEFANIEIAKYEKAGLKLVKKAS